MMHRTRLLWTFSIVLVAAAQALGCASSASAEASHSGAAYPRGEAIRNDADSPQPGGAAAAPSPPAAEEGYGYSFDGTTSHPELPEAPNGGASEAPSPTEPSGEHAKQRAPLLIYDANLTLAVFETARVIDTIEKLATESGGYLVQRGDRHISVRVPSKAFQPALSRIGTLGDELHREVNVHDVTEEYSDLEIRLQNARAVRVRLEELLRRADKVEDALAVQRELERVTENIERMLGRLRLLRELVAFSTISVQFEARPSDVVESRVSLPFPWLRELGLPGLLDL